MTNKKWKTKELKIAKFFKTERTPLSGGNSKHTRSDTLHDKLFVEQKHRKKQSLWTLFKETRVLAKKENKLPVITLTENNSQGFLIVVHNTDLEKFIEICKDISGCTK